MAFKHPLNPISTPSIISGNLEVLTINVPDKDDAIRQEMAKKLPNLYSYINRNKKC